MTAEIGNLESAQQQNDVNMLVEIFDQALDDKRESKSGRMAISSAFMSAIAKHDLDGVERAIVAWMSKESVDLERRLRILRAVSSLTDDLKKNTTKRIADRAKLQLDKEQSLPLRRVLYRILHNQSTDRGWVRKLSEDHDFLNADPIDWLRVRYQAGPTTAMAAFEKVGKLLIIRVENGEISAKAVELYWAGFVKYAFVKRPVIQSLVPVSVDVSASMFKSAA